MTFLLMGGTTEAGQLATRMAQTGIPYESCVVNPHPWMPLPPGQQRPGPCAGSERMQELLAAGQVHGIVDASPPFAPEATRNAMAASRRADVPLIRLCRLAWEHQSLRGTRGLDPGVDARAYAAARLAARATPARRPVPTRWRWADDAAGARRIAETMGTHRTYLDVGRAALPEFADWDDRYVLARTVQAPHWAVPEGWELLCADERRTVEGQRELFEEHRVELLVTRDTGGSLATPKLSAAEQLGMFVVMMRRPALPQGVREVHTAEEAYAWVTRQWRPQDRPA